MMKNLAKIVAAGLMLIVGTSNVNAQIDPHFSQYYANPLWLNPALTGVMNGDHRFSLNAKQQWGAISGSYLTAGVSYDRAPVKNLAFGAMILDQKAGEVNYNYLSALASAAYRVRFGATGLQVVNFGIQAGILNRSFDPSKITTGSQYDSGMGYNGSMLVNDAFQSTNTLVPDVNAGAMFFDGEPDKKANVFLGISAAHLTRPLDKFMGSGVRIPVRLTAHGGVRVRVSDVLDITPNALHLRQGNARETAAGAYAQLMLNPEADLLFGSNYRVDDAAIAFFGLHLRNMVFGLSYDFNTSTLNRATGSRGGLELSVSFTGLKSIIGPNFFCPRL